MKVTRDQIVGIHEVLAAERKAADSEIEKTGTRGGRRPAVRGVDLQEKTCCEAC